MECSDIRPDMPTGSEGTIRHWVTECGDLPFLRQNKEINVSLFVDMLRDAGASQRSQPRAGL